jgi:hypothetical protein
LYYASSCWSARSLCATWQQCFCWRERVCVCVCVHGPRHSPMRCDRAAAPRRRAATARSQRARRSTRASASSCRLSCGCLACRRAAPPTPAASRARPCARASLPSAPDRGRRVARIARRLPRAQAAPPQGDAPRPPPSQARSRHADRATPVFQPVQSSRFKTSHFKRFTERVLKRGDHPVSHSLCTVVID